MSSTPCDAQVSAPPLGLMGIEPLRAALEYASMRLMTKAAPPDGDGHPVVIFPGLATDRHSIAPLKRFCKRLGYTAYDWGRGFNTGPQGDVDEWLAELSRHVHELVSAHDQRVSLIGWSLGGIYAREIAKAMPQRVRQVITIGTPFAGTSEQTNVAWVYRLVNGQPPVLDEAMLQRLRTPPEVPTTSIYSRSDGIVAWQACLNPTGHARAENIEVDGSHCGLGWNPHVLSVIADRLRQREHAWRPFNEVA